MSWVRVRKYVGSRVSLRARALGIATSTTIVIAMLATGATGADEAPRALTPEQRAFVFGQLPAFWRPSLSPDGRRSVMVVQPGKLDYPVAVVHEFETSTSKIVLASEEDEFDLKACEWANDERLVCRFFGVGKTAGMKYGATRLVAIDADGSDMRVLMQRQIERNLAGTAALGQFQDRISDWLPDDSKHVLIQVPDLRGVGLSRLNVYNGRLRVVKRPRDYVRTWITDGASEPRLRLKWRDEVRTWEHRAPGESKWETIDETRPGEPGDDFQPIGFGDDPNRLFSFRRVDGRMALVSDDLVGEGDREVVFAHDEVDVSGVSTLGPHGRIVAAEWATDRPHVKYFDPSLGRVSAAVRNALPGKTIVIADESWDRQIYLIFAYSDVDPGTGYRLDLTTRELALYEEYRPALRGVEMSPVVPMSHAAADGTLIPGYVTRPIGAPAGPRPTIVMPHGGPESRDVWGFDWLAQFLVSSGYVVFQTNYRGSYGYGGDWIGEGAFRSWRRAISDIDTGLQHLIDEEITDPKRVCALGWSYGGYASLLSALEHPDRYRCVVDIAGVSDPGELIDQYEGFLSEEWVEEMISRSPNVLKQGSAVKRAKEFTMPVLIFHPDEDLNVDVKHGRKLAKALRKAGKQVEYVEYEDDEHGIWRHASRIDMLTRIGAFLEEHLAATGEAGTQANASR